MTLPLTKSVSMLAISQRDIDGECSLTLSFRSPSPLQMHPLGSVLVEGVEGHLRLVTPVIKSVSLSPFPAPAPAVGRLRRKRRISISFNLSPLLTKSKSQFFYEGSSSSDDEDHLSK